MSAGLGMPVGTAHAHVDRVLAIDESGPWVYSPR
jgi:hypothetical protein